MTRESIKKRVIELFHHMTETKEIEEITEYSELIDDLEINSMDILFLISSLEEEFQITIPEKAIRKMVTIGDVVDIIAILDK